MFAGDEPLQNPANEGRFGTLLDLGTGTKPFECVGDVDECRAARCWRPGVRTAPGATTGAVAGRRPTTAPTDPTALLAAPRDPPHP